MAAMAGDWEIFTRNWGGGQEMGRGVWFYNGEDGKFFT